MHGQLARYARIEIQDLYKLVYQAAMGSEHAVSDTTAARVWLDRELAELQARPAAPIIESITPNGELVRVNLRPFIGAGRHTEALLAAFIRTANEFPGSRERLARFWSYVEAMAETGEIRFGREELATYFADKRREGFPTVHHSVTYVELYKPAYRVVLYEYLMSKPTSY